MTESDYQRCLQRISLQIFGKPGDKARSKTELLKLAKQYLRLKETRIRMRHDRSFSGSEICRMRSDMIDELIRVLWLHTTKHLPADTQQQLTFSICAHGGYGRRVMSPGSDIDLTFLFPGNTSSVSEPIAELIRNFLLFLYDLKFKVGHGSRSVGESIRLANESMETKTALMELRHLTGPGTAFQQFTKRFPKECIFKQEAEFLRLRQKDLTDRHRKHGGTPYVQEPHVKNGCGGLRDYQNLIWMTYAKFGTLDPQHLVATGNVSAAGWKEISKAYDFILRVRNAMHYAERRCEDKLTLRLQGVIATHLGYKAKRILHRIEAFMRDYYTATRDILQRSSEIMDRFHLASLEPNKVSRLRALNFLARNRSSKISRFDGFIAKNERIFPESPDIFQEGLIRLFSHTQQRHLRLSPELFQLVQDHFRIINAPYRYQKTVRDIFLTILGRRGDVGRTLRQMHRVGILGRLVPEFGALTCLVQHEFFHQFTADEHTLRTIEMLDSLSGEPQPEISFYQKIFRSIQEPWILYLALLMHDTGRAANKRSHDDESVILANAVCRRLVIKGDPRQLIIFLVDNHLLMYRTATTKNLEDPHVIEEFAAIVRTQSQLDALLVITFADSKGTSSQSWSGYKEASIRRLYHLTSEFFNAPLDFMERAAASTQEQLQAVEKKLGPSWQREIQAHFEGMPPAYFSFRSPQLIIDHLKQFRSFFMQLTTEHSSAGLLPIMSWQNYPEQSCSEITLTCWDRPQLLARIAGALAAQNINILSADLYHRNDDLVLDLFRVCTPNFTPITSKNLRTRFEQSVSQAFLQPAFDFTPAIATNKKTSPEFEAMLAEVPQRIFIDNTVSMEETVIELQAVDRLGLLYDVLKVIGDLGYNVTHARINTEKGVAVDTIYVRNQHQQKIIDSQLLDTLAHTISGAIQGEVATAIRNPRRDPPSPQLPAQQTAPN
jgi:[protein-PII] uridylyltransferase